MNYFTTIILALVSFYILLLTIVFFFQRNLLYHPSVDNYLKDQVTNVPTEIEKVKITTLDNINLVAWFYNKNIEKFKTILFFHGNAGSLENRTYKLNHFKDLNVNFLIIAWRGFNGNKGKKKGKEEMRLAVYGTLRNGSEDTGRIENTSLVYPGHQRFPAVIQDYQGKGTVVEVHDITSEEMAQYDLYEGLAIGLYDRVKVKVNMDKGEEVEAWVYVAGPRLLKLVDVFEEIPNGDWNNRKL